MNSPSNHTGSFPSGPGEIRRAARLLREGKLVAFPTETVYGLGADAFNIEAVREIFEAKRRPVTSPLIVHVASVAAAKELVTDWPETAERLARKYWPGPLTLVLPKQGRVPDIVTAGLPTVGVRIPAHPVALALLREAGVPVAAPSANPFTGLSPTQPGHLPDELRRRAALVLDGGSSPVGIESTVLSLAGEKAVLLRPGMISRTDIEAVIGPVSEPGVTTGAHSSPGMHPRHYSPATLLLLISSGDRLPEGNGAYLWLRHPADAARQIQMPVSPERYAAVLYGTLHELDAEGWDWIAVEQPPDEVGWAAIRDRLRRAAGQKES